MINIFCVLTKPRYTVKHVERLYRLLKEYLTCDFELNCLTDGDHTSNLPIVFINIEEFELDTWWNKVLVFNYAYRGLYFDLDIDIKGSIDFLIDELEKDKICTIDTPWKDERLFSQPVPKKELEAYVHYGNTSVMGWIGDHRYLVHRLLDDVFEHTSMFYGDDGFIHKYGKIKHFSNKIDTEMDRRPRYKAADCRISIHHVVTSP